MVRIAQNRAKTAKFYVFEPFSDRIGPWKNFQKFSKIWFFYLIFGCNKWDALRNL